MNVVLLSIAAGGFGALSTWAKNVYKVTGQEVI